MITRAARSRRRASRRVLADREQLVGQAGGPGRSEAVQSLSNRHGDRRRLTFAGQFRELHDEMVCFLIFDVEAH